MEKSIGFLNVYGQHHWHADAHIMGDEQALISLRNAIDGAIQNNLDYSTHFASDGEGYDLIIIKEDNENTFRKLSCGYTDKEICNDYEDDLWDYFKDNHLEAYKKLKQERGEI